MRVVDREREWSTAAIHCYSFSQTLIQPNLQQHPYPGYNGSNQNTLVSISWDYSLQSVCENTDKDPSIATYRKEGDNKYSQRVVAKYFDTKNS